MNRNRLGTALSLMVLAAPGVAVAAPWNELYLGLRGGVTKTSIDSAQLTQELRTRGHNVTATVDDSDSAFHVYLGKNVGPRAAFELGYMNLGEYDTRVAGTTTLSAQQLAADVADAQAKSGNAISFAARFQIPLTGSLYFTPRVGGFYWRSETEVFSGSGRTVIVDDGPGLLTGLGLDFKIPNGVHLGLGWELQRPDKEGSNTLFYGQVEYHFGRR